MTTSRITTSKIIMKSHEDGLALLALVLKLDPVLNLVLNHVGVNSASGRGC